MSKSTSHENQWITKGSVNIQIGNPRDVHAKHDAYPKVHKVRADSINFNSIIIVIPAVCKKMCVHVHACGFANCH